jgi:predicted metal-dependent peptidase
MKFSKIIGNVDEKLVSDAEEKLSSVFLELGTRYDNTAVGSGIGGDPFIFSLLYPMEHICTMDMPTAGTDGKRYYWNPKFVMRKDRIGLRIVAAHEAGHAIYMHPQRRGSKNPKLWNIAVDYLVNGMVMEDFKARGFNATDMFKKHLGNFITLKEYAEVLKDPFNNKFPGTDDAGEPPTIPDILKDWDGKSDFSEDQSREWETYSKNLDDWKDKSSCFFSDPDLEEDMKSPEKIYDMLYALLPKCPECGRVGMYQKPKDQDSKGNDQGPSKKGKGKKKESESGKDGEKDPSESNSGEGDSCDGQGDNQSCNDPNHQHGNGTKKCDHAGCGTCGKDGVDIFGFGDTLDEHMDTEESEEKLAKRLHDAMESASRMAGRVPAAMEAELGKLTEPKITWKDVIRGKILRSREGNDRNDWTRFRTRPMFAGMMTPKKKSYSASFGCLVDCSGSMSADDIAFGLSQLKSLDTRNEGILTPSDTECYWDKSTKIRACNDEELTKFKRVGLGGTAFAQYFSEYEENIGKQDFLIVITDGYLDAVDIANMKDPGIPVYWLVTSTCNFNAPFGKVMQLL